MTPVTPVLAAKILPQPFTPAIGLHNNPTTPNYFFGLKPARSPHFPTQTSNLNVANNFMCPSPKVNLGHLTLHGQPISQSMPRQSNLLLTPKGSQAQMLRRTSLN